MYTVILANILIKNFCKIFLGSLRINSKNIIINLRKNDLNYFLFFLKNSNFFNFKALIDLYGLDFLGKSENYRFILNYLLISRKFKCFLTINVYLQLNEIVISVSNLFNSASWVEREIFDMYGIFFFKNMDMRRILSDYGFEGFPLRKDFPLTGFYELNYSDELKVVSSNSLKLGQSLRLFHYSKVWDLKKK